MDPYRHIAQFYDCEHTNVRDDIEFYLNVVADGPVLEIGAGTGRIAASLARAGRETWGIEPSPDMLQLATQRYSELRNLHFVQSSAEDLDLEQRFSCGLIPLNTLWHLPEIERQLHALRTVRRHLQPDGLLVIDISNPHTMADRGAAGEVRQVFRGRCNGRTVTRFSAAWDDEANQILQLELTYDIGEQDSSLHRVAASLTLRYLYRWELELLVRLAGFNVRQVYGSYGLDDYTADSGQIILLARAV